MREPQRDLQPAPQVVCTYYEAQGQDCASELGAELGAEPHVVVPLAQVPLAQLQLDPAALIVVETPLLRTFIEVGS